MNAMYSKTKPKPLPYDSYQGPSNKYYHCTLKVNREDIEDRCEIDECSVKKFPHPRQSSYYWRPMISIEDIPSSKPRHLRKAKLDMAYDNCEKYYQTYTEVYRVKYRKPDC